MHRSASLLSTAATITATSGIRTRCYASRAAHTTVSAAFIAFSGSHLGTASLTRSAAVAVVPALSSIFPLSTTLLDHSQQRYYAAKRSSGNRRKENDEGDNSSDSTGASAPEFDLSRYEVLMQKVLEKTRKDLGDIRIGRANPALLDSVRVTHMGKTVTLPEIAQINVKDAHTLMIVVSDEQLIKTVEKAIRDANLGLNPMPNPPSGLKVPVPKMAKEFRDILIKNIKQLAEASKGRVRGARADARTALKRSSDSMTTDQAKKLEKSVQLLTDKYTKEIDSAVSAKEKEVV
ncbi:hypothetical protein BASA50_010850 [Batrachochytrium salamandrivorans]|uniref:Ribosome recycling factor domain-containing protein n=1 Tax=Batrachochytrium salamandrivorans TaxID=1357716 RepID=A0ABQ8EXF3_9FUNG|nr:hypothetical protein BASA62_004724 [Batrachochytrium salamandrivorans]KAH6575076.1 hypothetical protein BASA60_005198 [Batrachochytrium salamandrivorans]KAH6588299.1 hypothetical protein BASA50_010850 [Batrachochytrium salamandrivorans]KAH6601856.1 hypothetical protein BASA61_001706 [Batrachochytrium salamandrivorans]KAH9254508.1 ribosome recycling factor [Batrachochytrium salamandrivorans]